MLNNIKINKISLSIILIAASIVLLISTVYLKKEKINNIIDNSNYSYTVVPLNDLKINGANLAKLDFIEESAYIFINDSAFILNLNKNIIIKRIKTGKIFTFVKAQNNIIYAMDYSGVVYGFSKDLNSSKCISKDSSNFDCFDISKDGNFLFAGGINAAVKKLNKVSSRLIPINNLDNVSITSVKINDFDNYLYASTSNGSIIKYSDAPKEIKIFPLSNFPIIYSSFKNNICGIVANNMFINLYDSENEFENIASLNSNNVIFLSILPGINNIIYGNASGDIHIYNFKDKTVINQIKLNVEATKYFISNNSKYVACTSDSLIKFLQIKK